MAIFTRSRTEHPEGSSGGGDQFRAGLEAALGVSEIASSSTALPEAIDRMLHAAIDLMGADQGSLMLSEDDRALVLVAAVGLPVEVELGYTVPVGEGVAGRVLATGRALLLGEIDAASFVNFVPKTRSITSSMVVPLRAHGKSIGVLNLAIYDSDDDFTEEELRIAQMIGDQAAGLIYRAQLHQRAEQRSADLLALVESSRGLVGTLQVDQLMQNMLDGGMRLTGARDGFVCTFDQDSGAIARGVFRGFDKSAISKLVTDSNILDSIARTDVAVLASDEYGALASLGLCTAGGTRGVLVMKSDGQVAQERTDLLRAFAQQCSSALGSAELHTQIQRKETELSSIIQGVPNPIVLVDSQSRIAAMNPAAEQLFGIASSFIAGSLVTGLFGHDEVESFLTGRGDMHGEVVAGNPQNTYKVRATDVRVPGAPMGRVMIMDDVTREREIVQMQRDFVAMIGHELRTPLTIIKGFARTIMRRAGEATREEVRDGVATIAGKTDQLERLIEDLLYVSRIEAREATLRIERVNVAALLKTVAEDVLTSHKGRKVALDCPREAFWTCDETKMALVLRHLVDNALKYSDAPSPVEVRLWEEDEELCLAVTDKGIGIVSTDVPHIFERFRQVDNSSTRRHGGTGVGLYLCSQLIKMHGGRIWVDSVWGKGSTFFVRIPRSDTGNHLVILGEDEIPA